MTAIDRQVGGDHYKGLAIQPVIFAASNMLGANEMPIIKYVTRWRSKGGVDDLRKARHYCELILESPGYRDELAAQRTAWPITFRRPDGHTRIDAEHYNAANGLDEIEGLVVVCIWRWNITPREEHLLAAIDCLDTLIAEATR